MRHCSAASQRSRTSETLAAFAASDRARTVTAAHIDISAGTFMD